MKKSLRKAHFSIAKIMFFVIVAVLMTAVFIKQDIARLEPPLKLSSQVAIQLVAVS